MNIITRLHAALGAPQHIIDAADEASRARAKADHMAEANGIAVQSSEQARAYMATAKQIGEGLRAPNPPPELLPRAATVILALSQQVYIAASMYETAVRRADDLENLASDLLDLVEAMPKD